LLRNYVLTNNLYLFQELYKIKICPKNGKKCSGACSDSDDGDNENDSDDNIEGFVHVNTNGAEIIQSSVCCPVHLKLESAQWFKVTSTKEIFEIFDKFGNAPYILVGGNTAHGMFKTVHARVVNLNITLSHKCFTFAHCCYYVACHFLRKKIYHGITIFLVAYFPLLDNSVRLVLTMFIFNFFQVLGQLTNFRETQLFYKHNAIGGNQT